MFKNSLNQSGQVFIVSLIALGIIIVNTLAIIAGALLFHQNSTYNINSDQAINLAEAGIDKAIASINATSGGYTGESETTLGPGSYSVVITSLNSTTKLIQSTGYIPNKASPKVKKTIQIQASRGAGTAFNYAIQIGAGGITMGNGATINGAIYSNGGLTAGNGTTINGDAYMADFSQPQLDQSSDCVSPNCLDFGVGVVVGSNKQLDVAQSFKPSLTNYLTMVSLKIKKIGSPADATIKILADSNGKPNKNSVLATATVYANQIGSQYSFIDVPIPSAPTITLGTTYWIMIHAQTLDNSNYWMWSEDSSRSYTNGSSEWSPNWQSSNPTWTAISGDLGFQTYMGGQRTQLSVGNGSNINGSVHADTISGGTISKDAYYQVINNSTVLGKSYPNSSPPPPISMPVTDGNITDWKNQAQTSGTTTGDVTKGSGCVTTLGPGKFIGNLSLGSGCSVTIKSPIWFTGNVNIGSNTTIKLDPSLGASSGMLIVDGLTTLGNSINLQGSGTTGSYLMLISTYDSRTNSVNAITSGNGQFSGIYYASYGLVSVPNGATFNELSAWKISLGNSATLNYNTGLAGVFFSSSLSSGSYTVIKGTYQPK